MKRLILFFVLSFSGMTVLSAQNIEENAAVRDALDKMLERLKPNGDMEQFVFWISAYDNEDKLVYLIPIHLVYRPELTGDDFMPDDLPW